MRFWLHRHNIHVLCRRRIVKVRERTGTSFEREWLVGTDPDTGAETRIDATVFGGRPTYRTVNREIHE
jgi:hypothetical protein